MYLALTTLTGVILCVFVRQPLADSMASTSSSVSGTSFRGQAREMIFRLHEYFSLSELEEDLFTERNLREGGSIVSILTLLDGSEIWVLRQKQTKD